MFWALITAALVLAAGAPPQQYTVQAVAANSGDRRIASEAQPALAFDETAERQLLEMANQARARIGAPPLQFDSGMALAARAHADAMVQQQQLSHQFDGEPSLPRRLAAASSLLLDRAGENVALDNTAAQAHEHLMLSPPHRENLLDPAYNVAGFGVLRSGEKLYVVEDFGHRLPAYTAGQTEETIVGTVSRMRRSAHLPALTWKTDSALREAVCSMAQQDRLGTRSVRQLSQRYSVLSYANLHPEILPTGANRLIGDPRFRNFAVGVCYARTSTYPSGSYWVVLGFN